jgi:hypothetical protein
MGADVGQWLLSRHARHSLAMQNGVGAAQPASLVHPLEHLLSPLHTGALAGQSRCVRQVTHFPSSTRQNGAAAPQWLFVVQPTHCLTTGSQIGRDVPAHSASAMQPTH